MYKYLLLLTTVLMLLIVGCSEESAPTPTATPAPVVAPENALDPEINYKEIGIKYLDNGEFELAIQNFSHQIKLHPEDTESYVFRGLANLELYRFQDALNDFNAVLTLPIMSTDPDEKRNEKKIGFQTVAYLSFELGLFQDAVNNLDNALGVEGGSTPASEFARYSETQRTIQWLVDGVNYLDAGLYENAIKKFTEFIDCSWSGKPLFDDRGAPMIPEGCTEHNHNVFLPFDAEHPIGYFHRGVAYKESGDLMKATSDFTKVVELDPDNVRGFSKKATDAGFVATPK